MLSNLFDADKNDDGIKIYTKDSKKLSRPEEPRKKNNFCGIVNQKATCYLNSLLQTLFLTPEFRNDFFSLSPEELGLVPSSTGTGKVRVIPIELQRLFGQLLLLDQDSCLTQGLTDSFGWSNQEGRDQHDVQELNRILFSAIENSLVNTRQSSLIQRLYRGTINNKIHCLSCSTIRTREEEFLDLPITVQGSPNLFSSLANSFIIREHLNGNNQYKCETCNKYVDAEKYCQLKNLPPILTLSLLRFTYDVQTWQRIKLSDRFEFPLELDLKDYVEDKMPDEYTKYELFSVIIHSGSAYGGHYHTYIKDIENIGNWILDETVAQNDKKKKTSQDLTVDLNIKEITLIRENNGDKDLDYLKYDSPLELVKAFIYNEHKYEQMKIEAISSDLNKHGMSWNKLYKSKYGTVNKFLKKNDHVFEVTNDEKLVNLKPHDTINEILSANYENFIEEKKQKRRDLAELEEKLREQEEEEERRRREEQQEKVLENKLENLHLNCWFDFNDERVFAIKPEGIEEQFEGKESAYMLFYRRKQRNTDEKAKKQDLPSWLVNEIKQNNEILQNERRIYEKNLNEITVKFYLDLNFTISEPNKVLQLQNENNFISLTLDKRDKIGNVKEKLINYCTTVENTESNETFLNYLLNSAYLKYFICKQNQFGFYHISKIMTENENFLNFQQNSCVILSNNSDSFHIGDEYEPIKLIIKYYYDDDATVDGGFKKFNEFSELFTKQTTIREIKTQLSDITNNNDKQLTLVSLSSNKKFLLNRQTGHDSNALSEYQVKNGDYLIIENDADVVEGEFGVVSTEPSTTFSSTTKEQIVIEIVNFFGQNSEVDDATKFTQIELSVSKSDHMSDLKVQAISAFSLDTVNYDVCHIRYINTANVGRSELINEFKAQKQLFTGQRLYDDDVVDKILDANTSVLFVLCDGRPPMNNEFTLKCCSMLGMNNNINVGQCLIDDVKCEVILNKSSTVSDTVKRLTDELALTLTESDVNQNCTYYLKTINWFGDADQILNNLAKTLIDVNLTNNSYICLTKGFLVPQNHIKVNIWLQNSESLQSADLINRKMLIAEDVKEINKEFELKSSIICKHDLKLEDLKYRIAEKLGLTEKCNSEFDDDTIRIRLLKKLIVKSNGNKKIFFEKYQLKKAIFDWTKTLKQLNLTNEIDLCVQLVEASVNQVLNQGIILLDCMKLNIKTKEYSQLKEISWNINNGASLTSLKQAIIKEYGLDSSDLYHIHVAKRLFDRYDWLMITDSSSSGETVKVNEVKKTSAGKKPKQTATQLQQSKSNLKNPPYNLDDGCLIAFVLLKDEESLTIATAQTISNKEFLTRFDIEYKANIVDFRKNVKGNKDVFASDGNKKSTRNRNRPEVGIVIKTDDFNS